MKLRIFNESKWAAARGFARVGWRCIYYPVLILLAAAPPPSPHILLKGGLTTILNLLCFQTKRET